MLEIGKTYKTKAGGTVRILAMISEPDRFVGLVDTHPQTVRVYSPEGYEYEFNDGSGRPFRPEYVGNLVVTKTRLLSFGTDRATYVDKMPEDNDHPLVEVEFQGNSIVNIKILRPGKGLIDWSKKGNV